MISSPSKRKSSFMNTDYTTSVEHGFSWGKHYCLWPDIWIEQNISRVKRTQTWRILAQYTDRNHQVKSLVTRTNSRIHFLSRSDIEPLAYQVTTIVSTGIENISGKETEMVDLCTPPSMTPQTQIEIVDLIAPSTIDLTTPQARTMYELSPSGSPPRLSPTWNIAMLSTGTSNTSSCNPALIPLAHLIQPLSEKMCTVLHPWVKKEDISSSSHTRDWIRQQPC